jgi:hypothetical protein
MAVDVRTSGCCAKVEKDSQQVFKPATTRKLATRPALKPRCRMRSTARMQHSSSSTKNAGGASPVFWMDTKDGQSLNPGFVWSPDYTRERSNRVLYTVNSILLKPDDHHRGKRGFYIPDVNAHDMVKTSAFYAQKLNRTLENGDDFSYSFAELLDEWQRSNVAMDAAVVQDEAFFAFHITWSSPLAPQFGGGWTR